MKLLALSLLIFTGTLMGEDGSRSASPASARSGVSGSKDGTTVQEGENAVEFGTGGATRIDTQNPDFDRGMEFLFANRMPQALTYLARSLRSDPTNPQAHLNRAEAFYHLDDYEHQIEECNQAIELSMAGWVYRTRHSARVDRSDPLIKKDLASAYAKRGIAKWELKEKSSAVEDFNEAVRLGETTNTTLYIYRGQFYLNEGSLDSALQDFNAAIAADPKLAWPYGFRGLVELKQGRDALAAADFYRAGQIDPAVGEQCARIAEGIRGSRKK